MPKNKWKPTPADIPPGVTMVQVGPDHWIGLPTFDIGEWFDELGIPPDKRAEILERGGGYDGLHVSPKLERVAFDWINANGGFAASARTPAAGPEWMAEAARRFKRKTPLEAKLQEHFARLDAKRLQAEMPAPVAMIEEDKLILDTLADASPSTIKQPDLAQLTRLPRQKISERLRWMEATPRQWVARPEGTQRKGHAITAAGLSAIGRSLGKPH
jgi:hypothetical protein